MNGTDSKYNRFALVREMIETPGILRCFDFHRAEPAAREIRQTGRLLLTGEGSSRIFPAKSAMYDLLRTGDSLAVFTEGARQAHEYNLDQTAVFGASNSGRTKEVVSLFSELGKRGHRERFGLTASSGSKLEEVSDQCYVLSCGPEKAVAATKSVVEQALFYRSLLGSFTAVASVMGDHQSEASQKAAEVLEAEINPKIAIAVATAPVVYFAGRNNGVAEELALKTNEITHKKSDYLEGTYAVHGIEEVMCSDEVLVAIDPFPAEAQKLKEVLVNGVGLKVIAVAAEETLFPTIRIPSVAGYDSVLQLLAGWNLLVHVGVLLGLNLDKAERARKIGNVFTG